MAEARERRPGWRRRIRHELRLHYGAHLHRRLFRWFGAAIFLSVGTTLLASHLGRAWLAAHPWRAVFLFGIPALLLWTAAGRIARRISRPIYELTRAAQEIGQGNLAARASLGRGGIDEIGVLSSAFNDMAARLERQLTEQRELLAAVSHELRTPLARIRLLVEIARQSRRPRLARRRVRQRRAGDARRHRTRGDRDRHAGGRAAGQRAARVPGRDAQAARGGGGRAPRARARGRGRRRKLAPPAAAAAVRRRPDADRARARQPDRQRAQARRRPGRHRGARAATARSCSRSAIAAPASRPATRRASSIASIGAAATPDTTARSGSGLALVQRIALAHGGRAEAGNRPDGGARVDARAARRRAGLTRRAPRLFLTPLNASVRRMPTARNPPGANSPGERRHDHVEPRVRSSPTRART